MRVWNDGEEGKRPNNCFRVNGTMDKQTKNGDVNGEGKGNDRALSEGALRRQMKQGERSSNRKVGALFFFFSRFSFSYFLSSPVLPPSHTYVPAPCQFLFPSRFKILLGPQ